MKYFLILLTIITIYEPEGLSIRPKEYCVRSWSLYAPFSVKFKTKDNKEIIFNGVWKVEETR